MASAVLFGGAAWWLMARRVVAAPADVEIGGAFDWSFLEGDFPMDGGDNLRAFLRTIRYAEGTAGEAGYQTRFGGGTFDGYAAHPGGVVTARLGGQSITSSAAGAYQFLQRTWEALAAKLGLSDFSPESQDRAAVELIRQAGALDDVRAGRFDVAANKVRRIWASFPGAGYGQPEKALADLRRVYLDHGGSLA